MKRSMIFIAVMSIGVILSTSNGQNDTIAKHHSQNTVRSFLVLHKTYSFHQEDGIERFSLIVNGPESQKEYDTIIKLNPSMIFLKYQNMISVERQVTPWADDILLHHKDFLLKTIGGIKDSSLPFEKKYVWGYLHPFDSTKKERNYVLLDPRSEGWANYYSSMAHKELNRMKPLSAKGIFVDNVWPFYILFFMNLPKELKVDMNGDSVMNKEDNWIWAEGMVSFSKRVKKNIGVDHLMIANYGTRFGKGGTGFFILANGSYDGVMNETFAHCSLRTDADSYPSSTVLEENVTSLILADSLNKYILAQSLGGEDDAQARIYSLATFLLGAGEKAMFNYRFHNSYDTVYRMPEFEINIGSPKYKIGRINDLFKSNRNVLEREFEYGRVIVNPSARPVECTIFENEEILELQGGRSNNGGKIVWLKQKFYLLATNSGLIVRNIDYSK
jgi:hypothetical protein